MSTVDLSEFFQTKAQANDFSSRLSSFAEEMYQIKFNLEHGLTEQFGMRKKDAILRLLRENNITTEPGPSLKQFLIQIQKDIASLPLLSITLAFEPSEKLLQTISEWVVLNLKRQMLLDIQIDPELIAGAAISFNGRSLNFSIQQIFDQTVHDTLTQTQPIAAKA